MRLPAKWTALLAVAMMLVTLPACESGTGNDAPGTLEGVVTVEGGPAPGLQVVISGPTSESAQTDAQGRFSFQDVPAGSYQVVVSGFGPEIEIPDPDRSVTVQGGQVASVEFTGSFVRTASIAGRVEAGGSGVAGATVVLDGPDSDQAGTASDGSFEFGSLRAGDYTVTVEDVGTDVSLDDEQRSVTVGVGERKTVVFSGVRRQKAKVAILHFERPGSSLRFNTDDIRGEVDVVVEVDPGTETVETLRLFFGEVQAASRSFGSAGLQEKEKLEIRVNTAEFDPDTGEPLFPNGTWIVEALADTEQRGAAAAAATAEIGLTNTDRIAGVQAPPASEGVVSNGRRWFGNRDLTFEVLPVIYDPDRVVGGISLEATGDPSSNGGPSLDLGSGAGQPRRVDGAPFLFTASLSANGGVVEDDPTGSGHTLEVVRVFDGDGVEITSDFVPHRTTPLEGFYVDFVAPVVQAGAAIAVDGTAITGGEWFSEGDFSVSGLSEEGSGATVVELEVDDADEPDPIVGVGTIADLQEKRNDGYTARVASLFDTVGNATAAADLPPTSPSFGVDRSPVALTNVEPSTSVVLNPDDDAGDGGDDNDPVFTARDPRLPSGQTASGYGTTTAEGLAPDGSVVDLTGSVVPNNEGDNRIEITGFAEGSWTVTSTTTDGAAPVNEMSATYAFVVDRSPPGVGITDPPESQVSTTAGSVELTLGGSATDANGVSEVLVTVRDADGGTAPNECEITDPLITVGTAAGQVDQNEVDVTDQAGDFSVTFKIQNAGSGTQQDLCFFIEAADAAGDRFGDLEPNRKNASARSIIDWN